MAAQTNSESEPLKMARPQRTMLAAKKLNPINWKAIARDNCRSNWGLLIARKACSLHSHSAAQLLIALIISLANDNAARLWQCQRWSHDATRIRQCGTYRSILFVWDRFACSRAGIQSGTTLALRAQKMPVWMGKFDYNAVHWPNWTSCDRVSIRDISKPVHHCAKSHTNQCTDSMHISVGNEW